MVTVVVLLTLSWLVAFAGYIGALGNLSGKTSWRGMLFNSFRMLDRENFTPRGRIWRTVYFGGFVGFFACAIAFVVLSG